MARKQQLINYHTSKAIMPEAVDVQLGEIVVRHATDKPELLIKKDNNEFATFVDSGKVQSMITTSSTNLQGQITAISNNLTENYATSASTVAAIEAVNTKLTNNYADSASTVAAIKVVDDKFGSYATSADTVAAIKAVDDKFADYATSADTVAAIKAVDDRVDTLSGNVESLKTDLTDTINEKVARAYRYKGSCTYAELPESGSVIGEVWNVTDANGNYPAGTNYAWTGTEWYALGGSVDLSPYALKTEVSASAETLNNKIETVSGKVDTVSTSLETFKTTVANTYATKTELEATSGSIITAYTEAISAAKKEATDASSAYTDTQVKAVTSAYTKADNDLDARIDKLEAISAHTQSAVQNVVVANTDANKIAATKTGENNVVTLNFDNMVIDCGGF